MSNMLSHSDDQLGLKYSQLQVMDASFLDQTDSVLYLDNFEAQSLDRSQSQIPLIRMASNLKVQHPLNTLSELS